MLSLWWFSPCTSSATGAIARGKATVSANVLDTVLAQLNIPASEYFERIEQSLDEAKERRLQKAAQSKELDELVHQDLLGIGPEISAIAALAEDETMVAEEGGIVGLESPKKAKERRSRARPVRAAYEESEETEDADAEPFDEEENQFRLAYRRAMRTAPKRPRDR